MIGHYESSVSTAAGLPKPSGAPARHSGLATVQKTGLWPVVENVRSCGASSPWVPSPRRVAVCTLRLGLGTVRRDIPSARANRNRSQAGHRSETPEGMAPVGRRVAGTAAVSGSKGLLWCILLIRRT